MARRGGVAVHAAREQRRRDSRRRTVNGRVSARSGRRRGRAGRRDAGAARCGLCGRRRSRARAGPHEEAACGGRFGRAKKPRRAWRARALTGRQRYTRKFARGDYTFFSGGRVDGTRTMLGKLRLRRPSRPSARRARRRSLGHSLPRHPCAAARPPAAQHSRPLAAGARPSLALRGKAR
jgi:hypothetical protein